MNNFDGTFRFNHEFWSNFRSALQAIGTIGAFYYGIRLFEATNETLRIQQEQIEEFKKQTFQNELSLELEKQKIQKTETDDLYDDTKRFSSRKVKYKRNPIITGTIEIKKRPNQERRHWNLLPDGIDKTVYESIPQSHRAGNDDFLNKPAAVKHMEELFEII